MKGFNRLLGLIVALGFIVGGLLAIIEVIAAEIGQDPVIIDWPTWERRLRTTSWSDARGVFIIAIVLALVLLLLEFVRRAQSMLPVVEGDSLKVGVRRRFLERQLSQTVGSIDGISKAKVSCAPKRLVVAAETHRANPKGLKPAIESAVQGELRRLALAEPPAIRTRLRSSR